MITIALDESGEFEKPKQNATCMHIGGIVFKCTDKESREKELDRLQRYFSGICEKKNCKYPKDLHRYRSNTSCEDNKDKVNQVKNDVIATLPDFLNGKGDWEENKPNGTYYIHVLIGDANGIASLTEAGISNLIQDNQASNRYEHMAYRSIENILFFNPLLWDDVVWLDLPTRVYPVKDSDLQSITEYETIGHDSFTGKKLDKIYQVTDTSSFRTAIATMILSSKRKNIRFENIKARSIHYGYYDTITKDEAKSFGFLYLSDMICSAFRDEIYNYTKAEDAADQLWSYCKEITESRSFIWTYNEFDQEYHLLYQAYEEKNYYATLNTLYKLSKKNEKNYKVYDTLYFTKIKEHISSESKIEFLVKAIEKLDETLANSDPLISVEGARFIYDNLRSRIEELCTENKMNSVLFQLYKTEFAIHNHEGNYEKAIKTFEKCKSVAQYAHIEEYFELRNMYSVSLCDSGKFKDAIKETKKTLEYENDLANVKEKVFPGKEKKRVYKGKTMSLLGQCFAFDGDFTAAYDKFTNALSSFGDEKESDWKKTCSYLLHAAIEAHKKNIYEDYAEKYFGTRIRQDQLTTFFSEDNKLNPFALYVYLKAYYVFYRSSTDKNETENVLDTLKRCCENNPDTTSHPWEMIYKYASFLAVIIGKRDEGDEFIKLAKRITKQEGILKSIMNEIDMQYQSVLNGKNAFEKSKLKYMYR